MRQLIRIWTQFLLLFLCIANLTIILGLSNAQAESVSVRRINNSDGLSHFDVRDAIEDDLGRIWLATANGVNIYDGYDFIVLRHEFENNNSLSATDIQSLYKDKQNNIWIGTLNGGINHYNQKTNKITHYTIEGGKGHASHERFSFFEDSNNTLWVGNHKGLIKYDRENDKFTQIEHAPQAHKKLPNDAIKAIAQTEKDYLWLGFANSGLCKYSIIEKKCKLHQRLVAVKGTLTSNQITALHVDRNKTLWIGTADKGINLLKFGQNEFENYDYDFLGSSKFNTQVPNDYEITSFDEDASGNIWIGTNNGGLNKYDIEVEEFSYVISSAADAHTLSSNSVSFIFVDSNDRIWAGSPDSGVSTFTASGSNFSHFRHDPLLKLGPQGNIILNFAETTDGTIWVGSRKGLDRFTPWTEEFKPYLNIGDDIGNEHIRNIHSLLSMGTELWIGTKNQGLFKFNPYEQTFKNWNSVFHDNKLKTLKNINHLYKDKEDRIWIAENLGLYWLHEKTEILEPVKMLPEHLFSDQKTINVTSFYEDQKGVLWIGTSQNLLRYNMEQNIFEIFTYQGFKFPNVNALYEDNNNLWLATNNGLYQINYNEETIENFSESYDFPSSLLFSLLPDQLGNLWITTNNGLVRFNMENKKLDVFTQHDGLQSNGFNRGAYIQTDAGAIYIGGVNGFNKFDPQDVQDHSTSKTLLSGEVISRDGNTRQMKVDETGIQLKYQHDRVEFKFTPIHFKNPAGNRFSYRLFNYDTVWHDGVARNDPRIVAYEDLPPGDYIFTLRTSANIGVWSAPSSIKFSIAVPFWQTWWAVLIYTILAAAVVAGLIAWRNRHLTQKAANLKKIIENKTQEIINKNNELEELLDFRSRFYRRAAHEIRTPLTLVQLPLQEYVTEKINVSGGEYEHQKIGALVMVLRNIQRLKRITDQMLSYSKNTYVSNDDLQIIDLRSTLLPLLTMTEKNAAENGIRFFYDDIPKAAVTLDRDALEDIVVNLLSNAIKYTNSGGTVMFNLQLSKDALNIEVHDTGIGISKSELETVFQPFFRGEDIHDDNGFGVGLSVVKEKIERSKSKITMHSIKDEGTEFIVTMPILLPSIDELSELPDNLSAIEYWPTNTPAEERPSLLVIEDDSDMCTLLRSILSTEFNVNLVNNCKDAKSSITEKTYDAVLTDALLPDGSGFDLVMHFRAQDETAHLPIIMLTALAETEPMERALELGVDDYVVKPFSSTELLLRVKSHISNRTRVGHWWRQQSKSDYSSIEESTEKLSTQRVLSPKDSTFLDILRSYIEEHVGDSDLTLPIAAKEVAVSERQIQRKLKTLLDTTFTEYLTEIRMRKAASLLETGITVKEVSALVGYNDASHFASLFKERFGVTPSKFKSGELESYQ